MHYLEGDLVKFVKRKTIVNILKSLSVLFFLMSCTPKTKVSDLNGMWVLEIDIQGSTLTSKMEIENGKGRIINSIEMIEIDEIKIVDGKFIIPLSIYPNTLEFVIEGKSLRGHWVKNKKDIIEKYDFVGGKVQTFDEITPKKRPDDKISGKWKIQFFDENGKEEEVGIGLFKVELNYVRGTILTETGDYRFLEGTFQNDYLYMQGFDGQNGFVLKGELKNDQLELMIYAGKTWNKKLVGKKAPDFELADADKLTKAKGDGTVSFKVEDLEGNIFTHEDPSLKGKPYIIQIYGSWCPNCLDEARFLNTWKERTAGGIPIVPIGFERANSKKEAIAHIQKKIDTLKLNYKFYLGSFDKDKEGVLKVLPFLENHMSYPTMIFVNKLGKVHKIHTGFSGPATGMYFQAFVYKFINTIKELQE